MCGVSIYRKLKLLWSNICIEKCKFGYKMSLWTLFILLTFSCSLCTIWPSCLQWLMPGCHILSFCHRYFASYSDMQVLFSIVSWHSKPLWYICDSSAMPLLCNSGWSAKVHPPHIVSLLKKSMLFCLWWAQNVGSIRVILGTKKTLNPYLLLHHLFKLPETVHIAGILNPCVSLPGTKSASEWDARRH